MLDIEGVSIQSEQCIWPLIDEITVNGHGYILLLDI